MTAQEAPMVTILMAIRNGAAHLEEQLESIAAQTHDRWRLLVSDDGSTDASRDIIADFANRGHAALLFDGPGKGSAANFMSLIQRAAEQVEPGGYLAFSDQDDVWMPHRLSRGLTELRKLNPDLPALFCSRSLVTDEHLKGLRLSADRPRPPGFRNALVQNIAAGNTILLNPAAARLVCEAAMEAGTVVVHDWWVYLIVTGAGGAVVHEDEPLIYYRQHGQNAIGANDSAKARLRRIAMILEGRFKDWNDVNIEALRRSAHRLTPQNRALLEDFARMRSSRFLQRLRGFPRLGLYRQHVPSTCALWISAMIGRL